MDSGFHSYNAKSDSRPVPWLGDDARAEEEVSRRRPPRGPYVLQRERGDGHVRPRRRGGNEHRRQGREPLHLGDQGHSLLRACVSRLVRLVMRSEADQPVAMLIGKLSKARYGRMLRCSIFQTRKRGVRERDPKTCMSQIRVREGRPRSSRNRWKTQRKHSECVCGCS